VTVHLSLTEGPAFPPERARITAFEQVAPGHERYQSKPARLTHWVASASEAQATSAYTVS